MTRKPKKRAKKKPANRFEGMTRKEKAVAIARLGGLARAKALTKEQRQKISAKGGLTCLLQYGHEFYSQMTLKHWHGQTEEELKESLARLAKAREKHAITRANSQRAIKTLSKGKASS